MSEEIKRGDVVLVDLSPTWGAEKSKTRPCVVIQNNTGNKFSSQTIVAVITSQKEMKKEYPTDVWVDSGEGGLKKPSVVQCDQIRSIDKQRIVSVFGCFDSIIMRKINRALTISMDINLTDIS